MARGVLREIEAGESGRDGVVRYPPLWTGLEVRAKNLRTRTDVRSMLTLAHFVVLYLDDVVGESLD